MTMFYLAGIGFMHPQIHGDIPPEAVELSDEDYAELLDAQRRGKEIHAGSDGRPVARDPVVSAEAAAGRIRRHRDRLLAASDWVVTRATETGAPVPPAWVAYRQALRDVPEQPGFPLDIVSWPDMPA